MLALKFAISFAIPDTPHEVQIAKAKNLYESNQALRREVRKIYLNVSIHIRCSSLARTESVKSSSNNQEYLIYFIVYMTICFDNVLFAFLIFN